MRIVNKIYKAMDRTTLIEIVILNLQEKFGTVHRQQLLDKLGMILEAQL